MEKGLFKMVALRFGLGMALLGAAIFLLAGGFFWQGWLFLGALAGALAAFGVALFVKDKELLKKRLTTKEKEKAQLAYVLLGGISLVASFALSALDHRFGWSSMPVALVYGGLCLMLAGYGLYVVAILQNRYASRVIEVQQGQKVIDTGVYAALRHPLYAAAIVMFTASPLVLGSYYGMIPMVLYVLGIVLRIRNEEEVLIKGLPGYADYAKKVEYRLIPHIW